MCMYIFILLKRIKATGLKIRVEWTTMPLLTCTRLHACIPTIFGNVLVIYLEKRTCVVVLFSLGSVLLLWSPITYVKEADSYFFSPSRLTLYYMNSSQILIWALNKRTNVFTLRTPSVLFYYSFIRCGWVGFLLFLQQRIEDDWPCSSLYNTRGFPITLSRIFSTRFSRVFSAIVRGFYDDVRHLFSN